MELTYPGKMPAWDVIHKTPAARLDTVSSDGPNGQGWANRLYHGDNLSILKALHQDPAVRGQVRLVYIDPPYASSQSFRHRKNLADHAYDDVLAGHHYIEFLRRRLILLRELLADDGSIYVHLDSNMAFHVKVIMDEVFGAQNFRNWITRKK